jgi:RNA polymerase sigma-70 factor (ECF subfamily)
VQAVGGDRVNDDAPLLEALKRGDEEAFRSLVAEYHAALLRVAMIYVRRRDVAEEVVQETWLAVLRGLERFEGRSSLRTWIFRIASNIAKTRGERERRSIPLSTLVDPAAVPEAAVPPERFRPPYDPSRPGWWASPPPEWDLPEERALAAELNARIQAAIDALPAGQRAVITLRDVLGWPAEEVCNALDITATNQRVLLHRARSKVRRSLEEYMAGTGAIR